jgi:Tol biopolymer transport system component
MKLRHPYPQLFAIVFSVVTLLLATGVPTVAQSARDREEKAQSKSKEDRRDNTTVISNSTVIIHDNSGIGGGSIGVGTIYYPGRTVFGRFRDTAPRIAFISDRGGVPNIYIMWENGSDLEQLTRGNMVAWRALFSPVRGRIAYLTAPLIGQPGVIRFMNADGARPKTLVPSGLENFTDIAWFPNDDWLAGVSEQSGNPDIYLFRSNGRDIRRLTDHPAADTSPTFSPDGQKMVFVSTRDGNPALYSIRINNKTVVQRLTPESMPSVFEPTYSPDGQSIAFVAGDAEEKNIYLLLLETKEIKQLTRDTRKNISPVFSPDGRRIAFSSNRNGNFAIYTMDTNGENVRKITFGNSNDTQPTWW